MTISDEASPQDRDSDHGLSSHLDIENLVRLLHEKARAAEERAKAADDRSLALAERVALLERHQSLSVEKRPSLYNNYESEPFDSEQRSIRFLELGTGSIRNFTTEGNDDAVQTVVGIEESNKNFPDIAERINLMELRLDEFEKTKNPLRGDEYTLPESTFSLLVTEHPGTSPFVFAMFTVTLSITCLGLVLADAVSNGTEKNKLNVPPGVSMAVRGAQFVGLLVGVLFEDECPQGLQHLAFGAGHTLLLNKKRKIHKRLIAVSILRLVVGYLFLSSLFINVVQNSDVIAIFYDVLALEFVENIDDTSFALAKRGFLGQRLLVATVKKHTISVPRELSRRSIIQARDLFGSSQSSVSRDMIRSGSMVSNSRSNNFARLIYFLNALILLAGLTYIAVKQSNGEYRCNIIHVSFNEEIWEEATIAGNNDKKLLVYPYFNGIYVADGSVDGHPRYVEQDKHTGRSPFVQREGAVIRYCEEIESWVFMHPDIETSNECSWLFRSYQTSPQTSYDVISAAHDPWIAWIGEVVWNSGVVIKCTSCSDDSDCSYQGNCYDSVCFCNNGRTGDYCEFEMACPMLATEKAEKIGSPGSPNEEWFHENPITLMDDRRMYSRPVYIQKFLSQDPFDWRKFDVRQREPTSMPSARPSAPSSAPTPKDTLTVGTDKTLAPTYSVARPTPSPGFPEAVSFGQTEPTLSPRPTESNFPTVPTNFTMPGTYFLTEQPTDSPTKPWYSANEYELDVPDFSEHDDFFESKPLHDLEDIMQNYSVVMSFTGSRYYATIVDPDLAFNDVFPQDYHSFWDTSFDVNRTFVISDVTDAGTPVGIDFYEMRRRVPSIKHENVHFAYGPYGALIPNMNYEGAGFFHCLDDTM